MFEIVTLVPPDIELKPVHGLDLEYEGHGKTPNTGSTHDELELDPLRELDSVNKREVHLPEGSGGPLPILYRLSGHGNADSSSERSATSAPDSATLPLEPGDTGVPLNLGHGENSPAPVSKPSAEILTQVDVTQERQSLARNQGQGILSKLTRLRSGWTRGRRAKGSNSNLDPSLRIDSKASVPIDLDDREPTGFSGLGLAASSSESTQHSTPDPNSKFPPKQVFQEATVTAEEPKPRADSSRVQDLLEFPPIPDQGYKFKTFTHKVNEEA